MPGCERPECVEKMTTFELSEAYQDTSERGHGTSAGGEGADEVNKLQFRERWTKKRNTMMMSSEQQIHETQVLKETKSGERTRKQQWKRVIELLNNKTNNNVNFSFILMMAGILATRRELQTTPRQQDVVQEEIRVATEPQQSLEGRHED